MPLDKKDVQQVAKLARLKSTPSEIEKLTAELPPIFECFDQFRAISTDQAMPLRGFEVVNR